MTELIDRSVALLSAEEEAYFQGTEGLVQVFEFDKAAITKYDVEVSSKQACCLALTPPCCLCCPCIITYRATIMQNNVSDYVQAMHVCLTQDGIRYVVDKHKSGLRFDCQDIGKVTKTVPYDKLTDCDIEEPAGAEGPCPCCLTTRTLSVVNVDTASGSRGPDGQPGHELTLRGLRDSQGFKEMVWRMKRRDVSSRNIQRAPEQAHMGYAFGIGEQRSPRQATGDAEILVQLRKQNELLARNNELLQEIARNTMNTSKGAKGNN